MMGMKNHAAKFWLQTTNLERGSLILFTAFMFLGIRSYAIWPVGWGYTTRDGLNTFLSAREQIFWKHRPYAQDDYINATGPFYCLMPAGVKPRCHMGFFGRFQFLTVCFGLSRQLRRLVRCEDMSKLVAEHHAFWQTAASNAAMTYPLHPISVRSAGQFRRKRKSSKAEPTLDLLAE
jgi:hypothetical protein